MSDGRPRRLEQRVVETGRESTLKHFEQVLAGGMNNPGSTEVHDQFSRLSPEARGFVRELIVMVVDATVFNTLRAIDEADEISIVAGDDGRDDDLREQADGFADRYLDPEGGWLQRYGGHRRSVFDAWMDEPIDESWSSAIRRQTADGPGPSDGRPMSVSVVDERRGSSIDLVTRGAARTIGRELRGTICDDALIDAATELLLASVEQLAGERPSGAAPRTRAGSRTVAWTDQGAYLEGVAVGDDRPGPDLRPAVAALGTQRWVCARFAAPFDPCADDRLVAISPLAMRSNVVVEGVRYVERRPDAGWFITDDEFAGGVGDLEHHHVRHLVRTRPELERFFGLGPGWRIH